MIKPFLCDASGNTNSSQPVNTLDTQSTFHINRRGVDVGWIVMAGFEPEPVVPALSVDESAAWKSNKPLLLPAYLADSLNEYSTHIQTSQTLYQEILGGKEVDELLDQPEYMTRLGDRFEILSTRFDEADRQELISVDFDALADGELAFEDIWMRVSWLSFLENEESLRFRFSFGMEGFDDVSLDLERQLVAAELCDRIFPESGVICDNGKLKNLIKDIADINDFHYLERIVYYNAKDGGAQFHHDAEKGHLGVVYAQLTGQTLWFALSKRELISEIQKFLSDTENQAELKTVVKESSGYENVLKMETDLDLLKSVLDDPSNDEISELLNESPRFFAQMMQTDHVYILKPGDVILLPQESMESCAWHSVFCLGDEAGQALSFAIKRIE